QLGTTTRVSVASDGSQAEGPSYDPAVTPDGTSVLFDSGAGNLVPGDTNGAFDVFGHDLQTGETRRVSVGSGGAQADSDSFLPSVSVDGRLVGFASSASNLVAGDTNGSDDVFVRDQPGATTTRASVGSAGDEADRKSV